MTDYNEKFDSDRQDQVAFEHAFPTKLTDYTNCDDKLENGGPLPICLSGSGKAQAFLRTLDVPLVIL